MIEAHWLQSTGAGDDVLEVTFRATSAQLLSVSDEDLERIVGPVGAPIVREKLTLYTLAHQPAVAQASEDQARADLAARRRLDA